MLNDPGSDVRIGQEIAYPRPYGSPVHTILSCCEPVTCRPDSVCTDDDFSLSLRNT